MKNLLKIWASKGQIMEGIKNTLFRKLDIEEAAGERREICRGCSYYDGAGKHCLAPGTQPCCGHCGCSLAFKTRSMSSECPIGRWKALMTQAEEIELDKTL
jgi:hypothetical protein